MRILHLLTSLRLGGAEKFVCHLADELAARKHEVFVAPVSADIDVLPGPGVTVRPLFPSAPPPHWPWAFPAYVLCVRRLVESFRPDVIHCHAHHVLIAACTSGVRLCLTSHSAVVPYWNSPRLVDEIYRKVVAGILRRRIAEMVVLSRHSRAAAAAAMNLEPKSIHIIPNGVPIPPSTGQHNRVPPDSPRAPLVIAWVGRMEPEKNPVLAVEVLATLQDRGVDCELFMCGDGSLWTEVERSIETNGQAGRVHLMGLVQGVTPILKRASIYLITSHLEGHSLALIEAMAAALPVVGTNAPGVREHLAGRTWAAVAEHNTASELADCVQELTSDPAGFRLAAGAAREASRQYSIERCADRYLSLYDRLHPLRVHQLHRQAANSLEQRPE